MAFDKENFRLRMLQATGNKERLIALMADIDEEKRSVRQYLSRLSSEPKGGDPTGKERQSRIRRMKTKTGHLTEYREIVRNAIADAKIQFKDSDPTIYYQAFYDSACVLFTPEQITECQSHAEQAVDSGAYDK